MTAQSWLERGEIHRALAFEIAHQALKSAISTTFSDEKAKSLKLQELTTSLIMLRRRRGM
jgi:hypothetical protein